MRGQSLTLDMQNNSLTIRIHTVVQSVEEVVVTETSSSSQSTITTFLPIVKNYDQDDVNEVDNSVV